MLEQAGTLNVQMSPVHEAAQGARPERGLTLIELMMVVAIIGILATVAVPMFLMYILRARSAEGVINIGRMANSASVYLVTEHHDEYGDIMQQGFPWGTYYPPICDAIGDGGRCDAGTNNYTPFAEDWTFRALDFEVSGPHYFSYSFHNSNSVIMMLARRERANPVRMMPAVALEAPMPQMVDVRGVACAEAYLLGPESERGHFVMTYGITWNPNNNTYSRDAAVVTDAAKEGITCMNMGGGFWEGGGPIIDGGYDPGYGGYDPGYGGYDPGYGGYGPMMLY